MTVEQEEFERRFPSIAADVRDLFDVHRAMLPLLDSGKEPDSRTSRTPIEPGTVLNERFEILEQVGTGRS